MAKAYPGRIYRSAYAQGLGATGLTFFDDDVSNFLSPHAAGRAAIFLVAVGKPMKRKSQWGTVEFTENSVLIK
jgi:hypothetical protein